MAFIKYIIHVDEKIMALKYDLERKEIIIGGSVKYLDDMMTLISTYFEQDIPEPNFPQPSKVKLVVKCPMKQFIEGKKLMAENFIHLQSATSLLNIMR